MPKQSISVTLEKSTIISLRTIADAEMRSVSNLIDYIVAQYATHAENAAEKWNRAVDFGAAVPIRDFAETQKILLQNVHTEPSELASMPLPEDTVR